MILFLLLYSGAQTASLTEVNAFLKVGICVVVASLLVLVYSLVVGKIEKRKVDELITPSACPWVGKGLLLGIGYFSVITAILAIFGMYGIDGYDVNIILLISCFIFYLVIAVGEEIIFRGIIFRMIDTSGDFGPEASIIAIILGMFLSAWFIWRYYKFQRPSKEQ